MCAYNDIPISFSLLLLLNSVSKTFKSIEKTRGECFDLTFVIVGKHKKIDLPEMPSYVHQSSQLTALATEMEWTKKIKQ